MIRSSYGLHSKDEMFTEHYNGAKAAGLKVGVYHYSYALTPGDAIEEAKNCSEAIAGFGWDAPDLEELKIMCKLINFDDNTEDDVNKLGLQLIEFCKKNKIKLDIYNITKE